MKLSEEKDFLIKIREFSFGGGKGAASLRIEFIITEQGGGGVGKGMIIYGKDRRRGWFLFREQGEMLLIRKEKFTSLDS